jgi:hypothetical protein
MLKKLKFYVVDKRTNEVFEFDTRGQAVTFGYSKDASCRHGHGRYDNCYIIPKSKGKRKVR